MLFASKKCSLEKVPFMNSLCFMICELNWIVFYVIQGKGYSGNLKYMVILDD